MHHHFLILTNYKFKNCFSQLKASKEELNVKNQMIHQQEEQIKKLSEIHTNTLQILSRTVS